MGWRSRSRSRLGGNTRRRGELAAALAAAGFWAGLPGQDVRLLLAEVVAGKPPLRWLGERGWAADGDDLAAGDAEEVLTSVTDALRRCGVSLDAESVKSLGVVNQLLAEAESDHRIAVFNVGGSDGVAVLLPAAAIKVLTDSDIIPDGDRPLVPGAA